MRTQHTYRHLLMGAALLLAAHGFGQATTLGNSGAPGDYLGWDSGTPQALEVRHDGNYPIQWWTDSIQRMRLTESLPGQVIGSYINENLSGNLGIGAFTSGNVQRPFSLLHLDNGGTQFSGYRPWFRPGMTITNGSDLGWIGLKNEGGDLNHLTLAWADNTAGDGPDLFKIIFLANPTTTGTAGTVDGLETMRILPTTTGLESFVGIGDWNTAGVNPSERLDLLDGKLRVRDLPNDPISTSNDFVTVNSTTGVLEHRPLTTTGLCASGWTLQGNNAVTAFNSNPCLPQNADAVGIGTALTGGPPAAKLVVRATSINTGMNLSTTNAGSAYGAVVTATGGAGSIRGVQAFTNGDCTVAIAGDFISNNAANNAIGIKGTVNAGTGYSYGVSGITNSPGSRNFGVMGWCHTAGDNAGAANIGLYGAQNTGAFLSIPNGNYGLFATTLNHQAGVDWAGWFDGNINVTGTATIPSGMWIMSDENLKENIADIMDATGVIEQLVPKSFDYLVDQFPQVGLPSGNQYGFIAQELQTVIPEAVKPITFQARLDSLGNEVVPALSTMEMNPTTIIPFLVAAFKEQSARIDALEAQLDQCCAANPGMAPGGDGSLKSAPAKEDVQEQRLVIHPNPFTDHTTLSYYVPQAG
ncbi:MAG: tail fiber domain-containing protein, partial [Flavobacteriales bacterium]|nr:tail fiber domain-containing protein [Flavobacteriales bacterium]